MKGSMIRRATVPALALFLVSLAPASALADSASATTIAVPAVAAPRGSVPPGGGKEATITKEQALKIIASYFGQVGGPGNLTATFNQYGEHPVWNVDYTIREDNGTRSSSFATVDATTGTVLNFHYPTEAQAPRTGPLTNAYPEAYARSWAWALVRDLYPDFVPQLAPSPEDLTPSYYYGWSGSNTYSFTWMLMHDGVPVSSRFVRVALEKDTLNYVGLEQTLYSPVTYTGGPATVTLEQAQQSFAAVEPQLAYQIMNPTPFGPTPGAKPVISLVYTWNAPPIAADSGKPLSQSPYLPTAKPEALPPASGPAQPAPALPLTADQAMALVRDLLDVPASVQIRTSPVPGPFGETDPNLMDFSLLGPGGYFGTAAVNLKTGRIQNVNGPGRNGDPTQAPSTPTAEQKARAKALAIGLVQRYFPDLSDKVRVVESPYYGSLGTMTFTFPRYQGNIPVQYNQISVTIDIATMKLESLYLNWQDDLTFPDAAKAISPDAARKLFLNGRTPRLLWLEDVSSRPQPAPYFPYNPTQTATMRLAYILPAAQSGPISAVNALAGEPMDVLGQSVTDAATLEKLLTGHRAEGELRYLLDQHVLTPAKLNPDAPITRGDALQLLQSGRKYPNGFATYGLPDTIPYSDVSKESPLFATIQVAISDQVLKPQGERLTFAPDRQMTRAEFAVWVARAAGLGKLARSGLKTQAPLGVTDPEQRNAIAFLEALGILSGGDYTAPLTQADAAAMTVRLIIYDRMQ